MNTFLALKRAYGVTCRFRSHLLTGRTTFFTSSSRLVFLLIFNSWEQQSCIRHLATLCYLFLAVLITSPIAARKSSEITMTTDRHTMVWNSGYRNECPTISCSTVDWFCSGSGYTVIW